MTDAVAEVSHRIVADLQRRLDEALAQQAATAGVLKIISRSTFDLQTVLETLIKSAVQLCGANRGSIFLREGGVFPLRAASSTTPQFLRFWAANPPKAGRGSATARVIASGKIEVIADVLADSEMEMPADSLKNIRAALGVPMLRDNRVDGVMVLTRPEPGPFSQSQIDLVQTFADQAVIAIENVRLFDEVQAKTRHLEEALQQQTATADVLRIISRSAFDLEAVFKTLIESAARLCRADRAAILRLMDNRFQVVATYGFPAEFREYMMQRGLDLDRGSASGRAALDRCTVHIPDILDDPDFTVQESQRRGGFRSVLAVPLLREGNPIGALFLTRGVVELFTQQQIELVTTFADQAVIAIENVRLFNETKEALERQTATADILKVIASSPSNVQPVFDAIAERSKRLVDALSTTVCIIADGMMHLTAFTSTSPEADAALKAMFPAPLSSFSWSEAISNGDIYRVVDTEYEIQALRDLARLRGFRSMLFVPLLRGQKPIGVIAVTRVEPGPFIEHHVHLLQTFADQAVIAISNVELFQQLQQSTRELSASLHDLRTAQDRLVQTEKLASLGQLTAGIAHEIKNPLNFVNNFSAVSTELVSEMSDVLARTPLDVATREEVEELAQMLRSNLEKVVQHGKRADAIVKNMLQHSREGSSEHRAVDINSIVDESMTLAYHGARAEKAGFNIALQRDLDPSLGTADVYPQEITRVLLNIISNGFYAASKRQADSREDFEPKLIATTRNLGDRIEIRIRDNGTGIPNEFKEKIFNPFFTTKPSGEGTGLGLSISHDIIVKQHGGSIDLETEPGHFTEFRIVLPRTYAG